MYACILCFVTLIFEPLGIISCIIGLVVVVVVVVGVVVVFSVVYINSSNIYSIYS